LLLESCNGIGYALSVCRVSLGAVSDMTILNFLRCFYDRTSGVLEQTLLLIRLQHTEEIAGLGVVVLVILAEVELCRVTIVVPRDLHKKAMLALRQKTRNSRTFNGRGQNGQARAISMSCACSGSHRSTDGPKAIKE
jgi:hypothetical protein